MNHQKNVPQGKFARSGILGVAAAKVGVKQATHVGKRPFIPDQRKPDADLENEKQIAKIIFDALSTLRGTALKAAQLISMEMELLPETYRQERVTFLSHWIEWITKPYRQDQFDFSKADAYFVHGMGQIRDLYRFVDRYEGSFTYYGRTEYGLMRLLQRLGARVRLRLN